MYNIVEISLIQIDKEETSVENNDVVKKMFSSFTVIILLNL